MADVPGGGVNLALKRERHEQFCAHYHDQPSYCERAYIPSDDGRLRRCRMTDGKCVHSKQLLTCPTGAHTVPALPLRFVHSSH